MVLADEPVSTRKVMISVLDPSKVTTITLIAMLTSMLMSMLTSMLIAMLTLMSTPQR